MMLSASATHALRAVAWLAAHERDEAVLGREMARRVRLPADYLAKVLRRLSRARVVTASRGARGGYRLARPAAQIRLMDVVRPFEGQRLKSRCLLRPSRSCRADGACAAHEGWAGVKTTYSRFLEQTTVADIQGGG
jgi:Rrf2 family protein